MALPLFRKKDEAPAAEGSGPANAGQRYASGAPSAPAPEYTTVISRPEKTGRHSVEFREELGAGNQQTAGEEEPKKPRELPEGAPRPGDTPAPSGATGDTPKADDGTSAIPTPQDAEEKPEEINAPEEVEKTADTGAHGDGIKTPDEMIKGQEVRTDSFYIDLRPKIIQLPPFSEKTKINIRYPLIPPFAYAHIYWDDKQHEIIYAIEEPVLDDTEKELLELIHLGLEEMINISFVRAAKSNILIQYLEKNVQSILVELGTKVSKKTYNKIMYYIYRNSVGLNEIEPLLNDYYVEDIECNGLHFPIYIVHRKYQNIRTNVIFTDGPYMTDFIEKLAQKTGRYVSYAKPLLDGTLPDGSRVNATYSEDITTRGPTFTIRKFTKEPWTPVHLIKTKTVSAEAFAYLWLTIENKFNLMVVGETASGKTTFLNCIVDFIPPEARICSIEDTRELNLAHDNWLPAETRSGFGVPTLMGTQFGEITLFDLLRESFRQNPDYVIVGEIRGKEAYVLFQGMASGHPSFSTFHAASVDTVVKRLETPPINLSPSLVESLDVVCICIHVKDANRNFRRLKEIDEILEVEQALGKARFNSIVKWDPLKDEFGFGKDSDVFKRITERTGMTYDEVMEEMKRRAQLLKEMVKQDIADFGPFNEIINQYYKDPESIKKRFNIK
ncbi:Flp pilus assembly complex ATPase component TadA [Candidatus Woesearchaeota archaeon]|nr:Flp pilus assembly complex ATPase component TadA [Candidatus Woesearchaeota archaeon]